MTANTLIADVLHEAESIVRAEWLRLLDAAGSDGHFTAACAEMPAARPRLPALGLHIAGPHRPATPTRIDGQLWLTTWPSGRWVWPTQRSPPGQGERSGPASSNQSEVMH